ncbi:hypothetical protein [Acetivibrio sp. MSJd-27]|uniref:hypothetical protein n=1 Tax=Acetivibrio sp. MSJd-27 TaxID=2841523 RepID=UPI001C100A94|nr:hypothetical protein [Acetivibrio sp. MSJd-27]MBU5449763.1 hypothetical protein [Acetivibrio sp. MSJd-27]
MKKIFLSLVSIIFIVILSFILLLCYRHMQIDDNTNIILTEFSIEVWNENPDSRIYIVNDLEHKYDIISMNKNEILNLLGQNQCVVSNDHITYTLGKKKEDLFLSYYRIDFNEYDVVIKTSIYQD